MLRNLGFFVTYIPYHFEYVDDVSGCVEDYQQGDDETDDHEVPRVVQV